MKKKISILFILLLVITNIFSDEWISKTGQKLTFINLTRIKFKDGSLENIGSKITRWKNASIYFSINKTGDALCEIYVTPDNYDIETSISWVSWLYTWFLTSIEDQKQQLAFGQLGFIVRYRTEFNRGIIEQYAALRRNGYVQFYNDMHFEAGGYKADSNDFSWLYPKYNEASESWNSGYLYRYIIGDFARIKDMPVPPGLDDSFKKDLDEIPVSIETKNWDLFNSFVNKYNLKLDNYIETLLYYEAPTSVFSNFSETQLSQLNYKNRISTICSNIYYLRFFHKYFSEKDLVFVKDYFKEKPDAYIELCKSENIDFSTLYSEIPEHFIRNCSLDNICYIANCYDITSLAFIFPKIETERVEKILENKNDVISNFLKFYYLDFDSVSTDKLLSFMNQLQYTPEDFFITKIYSIDKTIAEKLTDNKYSKVFNELFEKNILKVMVSNSNIIQILCDFENKPRRDIPNYKDSIVLTQIINEALFQISYKLYTNEISIEDVFSPKSITVNNCKVSLVFDNGESYIDPKKKSGAFLFGELKKGKLIKRNLSITNNKNETLLFAAIRNGNEVFAKQLINEGIDTTIQNKDGKKALDIAIEQGNIKIQKLLSKK